MSWFDLHGIAPEDRYQRQPGGGATTPPPVQPGGPAVDRSAPGPQTGDPNAPRNTAQTGGGGGTGRAPSDQELQELFHRYPPTNEGFRAAAAEADRVWGAGVWGKYLDHPERLDKVQLPGGRVIDMIGGAGGNNPQWAWMPEGPGHGGGGAAGTLGAMAGGNWQAGMDPSYGFVRDEALKAVQSGAAAKGTLLTGGFQKDMAKYAAGLASTEFGNIFGRNMSLANLGLNAAGQSANVGSSYSGQQGNQTTNQVNTNTDLTTGAGNAQAAGTAAGANVWGNTIGQLGAVVAPSAAGWLKRPGKSDGSGV